MRYYLIAGEASGDLHGSNLIKALYENDRLAEFRFYGGEKMLDSSQGKGTLVCHYMDGAVMGLGDVISKAGSLLGKLARCKKDIIDWRPDVVILIDYPGFNMKIAKFCHDNGIRNYYYIAPKTWASREGRNKKLKKYVDRLYIIFPFEKEYFDKHGLNYIYLGNPLLDAIDKHPSMLESEDDFRIRTNIGQGDYIALLAGSRKGEVSRMMPTCCEVLSRFISSNPSYKIVIAAAPSMDIECYNSFIPEELKKQIIILKSETYGILKHAKAAIVNSGTASLETALIDTPQVVCWSTGAFTAWVARNILKVMDHIKYISLGNLCIDRFAFKELVQEDFNCKYLEEELNRLVFDEQYRNEMRKDYSLIRKVLGGSGASERIAKSIIASLQK